MHIAKLCLVSLLATACTDAVDDDPGADFGDGKADAFTPPRKAYLLMDHPGTVPIEFTDDGGRPTELVYAELALSGPAHVSFEAGAVLYLYKPHDGYWGHNIGHHDGKLTADLDAGSYRLLFRDRGTSTGRSIDLVTGCTGDGCTPPVDQSCPDVHYGDGVCNVSLTCQVPDIDCFQTFADDTAAAAWFSEFEAKLAQEGHRPPRAVVPQTDPRYVQARALADRGWAAFRAVRPVGRLADLRPAVVVIEDPDVNAFVMPADPTATRAGFSIQVQTGLLALDAPDDGRLGVMMHELQHAVGLHVVKPVGDTIRRFYIAPDGSEPDGEFATDDPTARAAWTAWTAAATEVGPYTNPELGNFPSGQLGQILDAALAIGDQMNASACTAAHAAVVRVRTEAAATASRIDDTIHPTAAIATDAAAALAEARDHCLAGYAGGFADVVAQISGTTPDQVLAGMPAEDRALIAGKGVIDAIVALTADRRAKLRATEAGFTSTTGRAWTALRFYSREEAADDASVPVLRGAQLDPAGLGHFLLSFIGDERATCEGMIATNTAPFGLRLDDDHHGNCFRVEHIEQRAKGKAAMLARPHALQLGIAPPAARGSWQLQPRLSDLIVY